MPSAERARSYRRVCSDARNKPRIIANAQEQSLSQRILHRFWSDISKNKREAEFVYSDGFGREAQTKVQAEPGPLDLSDPKSPIANPRWVGTGEKVYNNKGKPIRQYEPFFSATPHFVIEKWGVSSTLFYDPVERVVAVPR